MSKLIVKILRETWYFWILFLVVGFIVGRQAYYVGMPWSTRFAFNFVFALLVSVWVVADAKRRQRDLSYGFPALVFFIWPIFAPVYLFQTRGVRAFLSLFGFGVLYYVSAAIGALVGRI